MKVPLIAAALLVSASANAQPPPQGWVGALAQPSILCDTSAQVRSIVDAFETGTDAGKDRLVQLFQQMNNRHEPTCAVVAIQLAMTAESTDLGRVKIAGNDLFGWIIHVKNQSGDGYYLYLESPTEALKNTI